MKSFRIKGIHNKLIKTEKWGNLKYRKLNL